jgi:adenosylcobinamide-GDP ribazoletransferase
LTDVPPPRRPVQDNRPLEGAPTPPAGEPDAAPHYPRILHDFVMATRFFSRLSMGDAPHETPDLNRMAVAVPIASLAIALLPALAMMLLCLATAPAYVAATVGVGLMIFLTGAMPEDALADSADGLFGGTSIERRLEIMKDSRHGTYGVVAIALYVVVRVAAIGAIATVNPLAAGGVMVAATILARSGALWLSVDLPPAREGGASASAGRVGRTSFAIGAGIAAGLSLILAGPFVTVLGLVLALLLAAGVAALWTRTCRRLVGGQSGDLIGALQALIEIAVLVVLSIFA